MSPLGHMLSVREETMVSGANEISATSSLTQSSSPAPVVPKTIPWLAVALLLCCVIAGISFSLRSRLTQRRRSKKGQAGWMPQERRLSTEKLLHPGWKKQPFALSIPAPAYTAVGDNIAPGQEDAVFRTTRDQRRALHVLYKPLAQIPPSPRFYW
ncbi:hypothetical protein C8F04DRAFT_1193819 [Mycena alexandri]|uniref:Uncharacterized protein n=1 Tax=Mycena alexandri TaxID=1745969 RepID=A0AAD6S8B8_9AGAR|nr:hypothetical protein C8F04DRAFT_1193819 [Mycena alexandri]